VYLLFLLVGNWLEVFFSFTVSLTMDVIRSLPYADDHLCRFLLLTGGLGLILAAMALAALSVHLLVTVITGSQGAAMRHVLLIGFFALLGLIAPIVKVSVHS
jgi:hypothetical protein